LASGKTETGFLHAIAPEGSGAAFLGAQISYPFPLAAAPSTHVITSGTTAQCPGSFANPTATSGNLCVYQDVLAGNTGNLGLETNTKYGIGVFMQTVAGSSFALFQASWAVTG
jgi:hypothetical protein